LTSIYDQRIGNFGKNFASHSRVYENHPYDKTHRTKGKKMAKRGIKTKDYKTTWNVTIDGLAKDKDAPTTQQVQPTTQKG
jgi:hypothetical protein